MQKGDGDRRWLQVEHGAGVCHTGDAYGDGRHKGCSLGRMLGWRMGDENGFACEELTRAARGGRL